MWGNEKLEPMKSFEVMPKGDYECQLENCTIEKTQTGNSYLLFTFRVLGDKFGGRKIWHKLWFTEKSQKMTEQQLENIMCRAAIPPCETAESYLEMCATACFKLVDKCFEVSVTGHNDYNGKTYPNTFMRKFKDTPLDWMKASEPAPEKSSVDSKEELPF